MSAVTSLRHSLLERLGPGALASPKPTARLRWSLVPAGLPLGHLVLLQGPGRTQAVAQLLSEHPTQSAVWVEDHLSAYPPGLAQQGVELERLLFVESGNQWPWVLAQLLRSQVFKVIVAASILKGPEVEAGLRRLQLGAERSQALILLLAKPEGPAWAIRSRLQCQMSDQCLVVREAKQPQANQATGAEGP